MSRKKDLFKSQNPDKFISSANFDKLTEEVESKDFIKAKVKEDQLFTPRADFSDPANFARFGLAAEYYRTSIESVYKTYPYDGSRAQRAGWYNKGSYLDQYILDNEYPRTTGYITLGDNYGTALELVAASPYFEPVEVQEYVTFNGGPHKSFDPSGAKTGSLANYYKASKNRENNLKFDLSTGVTVEFWLKKDAFDPVWATKKEVIFDLWNSVASSSAGYGRLTIEMSASAVVSAPAFRVTCQSGTTGFFDQPLSTITTASVADGSWHHYAFSFLSASAGTIATTLYRDGQYVTESALGTAFAAVTGTMSASLGALRTAPSGNVFGTVSSMTGYGKVLSSSFDEFRYWKTDRNSRQIFQNYNYQVGGGTNTDDANTDLGVYYKFNEGITTSDTVDAVVLDYSGRVSNGNWVGYASGKRSTNSAMVEATASLREFKDPIIYSFHPSVITVKDRLVNSGSYHDDNNNSALFFSMPTWILEEDESHGGNNLKYLTQIMSSYLDTLYLQIEELTKLQEVEYTSGSLKPNAFGSHLLSNKGLLAPELFVDASVIEQLYDRNDKTNFTKDLVDVKNKIYENIYNNLVHIYKSKGTYESFRNILNTLGISQQIVDINLYSNNGEFEILDNRKLVLERKKKLNFFKSAYNSATCYQATSSNADSQAFLPETTLVQYTPWTMESRFTLPRDNINSNYYFIENNILSCSLFGFHQTAQTNTAHTWDPSNDTTAQVYAVRNNSANKDGYFLLTGSILGGGTQFSLSSSIVPNLFDNTEWNVAVALRPTNWPLTTRVSGAAEIDTSIIDLRGYNTRGDIIETEFAFSGSISYNGVAQWLASSPKKCYVGAHRLNFTGSVYNNGYTFAKFDNFNFWFNYVPDNDLLAHLKDPKSFGITNAYEPAFLQQAYSASFVPPNIDTLALRWDFETVTGSDASGKFVVADMVSGSSTFNKYGWFGALVKQKQYTGTGYGFAADATDVVKTENVSSYKLANIDTITSEQMIEIRTEDDEIFLPDKRPTDYFLAAEKNFYGAINERIVETFATLKDFNNLIGDPANRYRPEYKELNKYRQLWFNRVQNELDFEKFIEYYKWIDTSISAIIAQLVPASADFSPELSNIVESHMLERNKYQHRLPVIKPMTAYGAVVDASPDSYFLSKKASISENLQNPNPITSSQFQTASVGGLKYTGSIENIVDTTYRNLSTSSYISGSNDLNIIGVSRTKSKNRKVGNFSEAYSQVMIPNKDGNNPFVLDDPFGSVAPTTDSFYVSGVVDYTLPNRPVIGNFITPRFAAPGGVEVSSLGYLDYETTQYSVYNNLNFRNLVVRKALDELRATASLDPTLFSNAASASSYNKNYRNPRREMISGTILGTNVTGTFYDNAWISYPIPASDLQYSWITSSYNPSTTTILTRQINSEDIGFKLETYDWWSVSPLSNIYSSSVNTASNTFSALPTTDSASNNYLSFIGKFDFPAWKEIRAGQSPIAKLHKQNNILSINDPIRDVQIIENGKTRNQKGLVANSFTNYIEPVLTKKYRPIKFTLLLNDENFNAIEVKSSYALNLAGFANRELNSRFPKSCGMVENYEKIKNLYLNSPDPETSPLHGWLGVEYSEGIWPKEKFEGVNSHRDKPNYDSTATELKNNLCQYRTIWKDTALNRRRSSDYDYAFSSAKNSMGNRDWFCNNIFPLSDYSLTEVEGITGSAQFNVVDPVNAGSNMFIQYVSDAGVTQIMLAASDTANELTEFSSSDAATPTQIATSIVRRVNGHPTASLYLTASDLGGGNWKIYNRVPLSGTAGLQGAAYIDTSEFAGSITPNSTNAMLSGGVNPVFRRDGELNSSFLALATASVYNLGYREAGLFGSGLPVSTGLGDPFVCTPHLPYMFPRASQTYIHRPRPAMHETTFNEPFPYDGHPYRVAQSSSRKPFFDSYGEYVENLKVLTDDYSIVPEFTFSDHAPYYYDQKGGDLRTKNKKILETPGAIGTTSSANTETSTYNSEFYKDYAYTEFLQQFGAVQQDHAQVGDIGEVTLTCKGIKKFLPKQGFYPVARAVQLGTLFSQSVGPNLSGSAGFNNLFDPESGGATEQFTASIQQAAGTLQSALQPLFSPGIFYNTVKSGIAVDWPIIFSGSLEISGNLTNIASSSNVIVSDASQRVPFEALIDLDKFPRNNNVLYLYPSWQSGSTSCSRRPYFNWDGNKSSVLYEKGMNNFLAEIPNFFLENKYFADLTSKQESDFKAFESGKTYYMDVSLRQTTDSFMWQDYFDGTVAGVGAPNETTSRNGRAFGPGWNTGSIVSGEGLIANEIGRDPSNAPYTPPYFYGESIARFAFTPSSNRKYTLDEVIAGSTVEYLNPTLASTVDDQYGVAWLNRMSLSSSVNLFTEITLPKISFVTDPSSAEALTQKQIVDTDLGNMVVGGSSGFVNLEATTDTDYNAWRIVPKFECPTLNFINQPSETYMSRGMWGGLGDLPSGSEGIFFRVQESFTGSVGTNTGSLADQLGFPTTQKRIGAIAKTATMEEAIVAIPFLERKNKDKDEAKLTTIAQHNFFKIDKTVFQNQIKEGKDTTLTRMFQKMSRYVMPPNYNFARYTDIDPFVMYIFEFSTTFSQQDLAYMWQGVMPDASLDDNEEFGEVTINHKTGPNEFFGGKTIPSDIRWLVFKVKKKARKSYSDVINLSSNDEQEYGYNWPYDYCSLVEMAKLDVNFKITPKEGVEDKGILVGKVLKGD